MPTALVDPTQEGSLVVYAVVVALAAAVLVGLFFASPLRERLTGPDDPGTMDGSLSDDTAPESADESANSVVHDADEVRTARYDAPRSESPSDQYAPE